MKKVNFQSGVAATLAAMTVVMIFALSGCSDSSSSGSVSTGDCTLKQYTGKIYVIGDIKGELADEIGVTFENWISYDGVSTDAPIFMAADAVPFLSDITIHGISDAYWNLYPIVVINGGEGENNALLDILGLEQNYTLPDGISYSELFAVDREEDGHSFTWSMYPPNEEPLQPEDASAPPDPEYTDNPTDQCRRAVIFHDWIEKDGERVTQEVAAFRLEAMRALAEEGGDETGELTKLAKGFVTTKNFSEKGNNYQLTYYVYACHSYNAPNAADYDWFYVRQEGMFNASGGYKVLFWYEGGNATYKGYYFGSYSMDNFMLGLTSQGSGVSLLSSNPQNTVDVSQVTSGISWNIGGAVGFNVGKDVGGTSSLSGGVTIQHSTTFNVSDCNVVNDSADKINNAKWSYVFPKRCEKVPIQPKYVFYCEITDPPLLSHGNFQPVNNWIWKFSPEIRMGHGNDSFTSEFVPEYVTSCGGTCVMVFVGCSAPEHHTYRGLGWKFRVPLPYPPLIVVPHNVDFSAEAQYKSMDIATAREWKAESDQDWCRVEPSSGTGANLRVNITVDANDTGKSRSATITFKLADNTGSDSMTVFQSEY